ncbi:MAG: thioredoxin family protein [Pirellulales bacterium]|nr:thioredoxin family protein [Pirellulales bacterium]
MTSERFFCRVSCPAPVRVAALLTVATLWLATERPARAQLGGSLLGDPLAAAGGPKSDGVEKVTAVFTAASGKSPAMLYITAYVAEGWHTYSLTQKQGKEGGPLTSEIQLPPSIQYKLLGRLRPAPPPHIIHETSWGNLDIEAHDGVVTWFVPIALAEGVKPDEVKIEGSVFAQACDDSSCLPPKTFKFTAGLVGKPPVKIVEPRGGFDKRFDAKPAGDKAAAPESSTNAGSAATARGLLAQLKPRYLGVGNQGSLWLVLGAAFIGGFILNFMPCVLPVIGLKILGFVEQSHESRSRVLLLNVWYAVGMLSVFWVLAGLAAFLNWDWGQQFQSVGFNVVLAGVVFAMALSFLGVWEIPIPGFVGGSTASQFSQKEGPTGAFSKGVLTTVLSTPCSGPFLGALFGLTLTLSATATIAIFTCVGLGMASPYLLIGAFPRLIRFLPKPGVWMETFKQLMGFLLLFTVVYLLTFVGQDYLLPTVALLISIWFGCWCFGRTPLTASLARRLRGWATGTVSAAAIGAFAFWILLPGKTELDWMPFSTDRLAAELAQGRTVLVDFTADWCPTCKFNEKTVLNTSRMKQVIDQRSVVTLKADLTRYSPDVSNALHALGSRSIPIYAIFSADRPHEPLVLRDLITKRQVIEALDMAGPSREAAQASLTPPGRS